jgi:hypothetical protein
MLCSQITQQVDEQAEGPPLTLTAVSGQSISLTTDMLKVRGVRGGGGSGARGGGQAHGVVDGSCNDMVGWGCMGLLLGGRLRQHIGSCQRYGVLSRWLVPEPMS